jgi:transcriptional regulator with XRE-family HTH domain
VQIYKRLFARRFKKAREAKELNQSEIAGLLKVEPPTISRWENAHDFPTDDRLPEILKKLEVSEEYFTEEISLAKPSDADLRRLITGDFDEVPLALVLPVLERFLNEDPKVRAHVLSTLYGDQTIARLYVSTGKAGSR